ncbi:MAG TPA: hypothetical protein VL282_03640, partial [Tepidisphaeraceae bacterium]|nr:hypothetical protein [Tepidisphaeraceae bacterium]
MPQCKRLAAALVLSAIIGFSAQADVVAKLRLGAQGITGTPYAEDPPPNPLPDPPPPPTFSPNPITYTPPSAQPSAGAKTDDATLNNYTTYDLQITLTDHAGVHDDFISAGITFKLTSGNFYIPTSNNSQVATDPGTWVAPTRYKEYDTWVS